MSSRKQEYANILLGQMFGSDEGRTEVDAEALRSEHDYELDTAAEVLDRLYDANWIECNGDRWLPRPTEQAWNYIRDRGSGKPVEILFYYDTGYWTGERCVECGATTNIDAQYSVGSGANFCGACGNQLKPDDVLEIRERTPAELRKDE